MPSALEGAASGAIGAALALACTFPLATAKVRLQAQRKRKAVSSKDGAETTAVQQYTGTFDVLKRVMEKEGTSTLYAGLTPALTKAASVNFIFYYFFELLSPIFNRKGGKLKLASSMLHGMMSGVCVQLVTLPSDLIVTRLMSSGSTAGYFETLRSIVESDGILELWAGLLPGLSLTLNPGITTLIRNALGGASSSPVRNFYVGLVSKATASTLTYPWTICKVQMQIEGLRQQDGQREIVQGNEGDACTRKSSMHQVLSRIVRENGWAGLYAGLFPQLLNAMMKEALLNMIRLEIVKLVMYFSKLLWKKKRLA